MSRHTPPATAPTNGVNRVSRWIKLGIACLTLAGMLGGGVWVAICLGGDARWAPRLASAQAHEKIDARLVQVEKDVAIISTVLDDQRVALDRQTTALERVLERIDTPREHRPLAPARRTTRRRRRTP